MSARALPKHKEWMRAIFMVRKGTDYSFCLRNIISSITNTIIIVNKNYHMHWQLAYEMSRVVVDANKTFTSNSAKARMPLLTPELTPRKTYIL